MQNLEGQVIVKTVHFVIKIENAIFLLQLFFFRWKKIVQFLLFFLKNY